MAAEVTRTRRTFSRSQLVSLVEGKWIYAWQTLVLYSAIAVLVTFGSEFNRLTDPSMGTALLLSMLSAVITVTLIAASQFPLRRIKRFRVYWVTGTLSLIGVARGIAITEVAEAFELNASSFLATRIFLGAGVVPIILTFAAFIVSTFTNAWIARRSTEGDIERLRNEREVLLDEIRRSDELLSLESENSIRPRIDTALSNSTSGADRKTLARTLERLVDEVIRPLSHALATRATVYKNPVESMTEHPVAPEFPSADKFVGPLLAAMVIYLTSVVSLFDVIPLPDAVVASLINSAGVGLGLMVLRRLMRGLKLSVRDIIVVVVFIHEGLGLIALWVILTFFIPADREVGFALTFAIAAPVPGIVYVAQRLLTHYEAVRLVRLSETRREMTLEVSEVRRRVWLKQRHIALSLHSAIQSRIHATSQLVRKGHGPLSTSEATEVASVLNSVYDVLRNTNAPQTDAIVELKRAIDFWRGMCEIELVLGDGVEHLATTNTEISESLLVTTLEAINNAIRHGGATALSVSIDFAESDLLTIQVTGNGSPVTTPSPGLGMTMFDELTVQWDLTQGSPTVFTAYLSARALVAD